jgi:putrescine transport system permease protein
VARAHCAVADIVNSAATELAVDRTTAVTRRSQRTSAVIALPYLWLAAFFLVPLLIVLKISFAEQIVAQPPYTPLWLMDGDGHRHLDIHWGNYRFLFSESLYAKAFASSLVIAAGCALLCLLIGYPMAYAMARAPRHWRWPLLLAIVLPFWTSFLLRVYAWMGLLNSQGVINSLLLAAGIIDAPLTLVRTDFALYIGIVYSYLPFMILPLYAAIEKLDQSLLEAAADLGAGPIKIFITVTLPLTLPGIIAGCALVFIPALGEFVIPELLGASDTLMLGKVLWDEFFSNRSWPMASTVALATLAVVLLVMWAQSVLLKRLRGSA